MGFATGQYVVCPTQYVINEVIYSNDGWASYGVCGRGATTVPGQFFSDLGTVLNNLGAVAQSDLSASNPSFVLAVQSVPGFGGSSSSSSSSVTMSQVDQEISSYLSNPAHFDGLGITAQEVGAWVGWGAGAVLLFWAIGYGIGVAVRAIRFV